MYRFVKSRFHCITYCCCLLCCTRWLEHFESMDEIPKCDHSNESSRVVVLSCGTVYYAVQGGSNF